MTMDGGVAMSEIDEIMKLLSEAKRAADRIDEQLLAYHIGTALLLAQEIAIEKGNKGPRR